MKKFAYLILICLFVFVGCSSVVLAKERFEIPEIDGVYDDPGHPGIKVRVFVHKVKPERPSPTPNPNPVCQLADPESSAEVSSTNWHLPSNWTYNLNPGSVPASVGQVNLSTIALNGFSAWREAVGRSITFAQGETTTVSRQANDGKNIVSWGRTSGSALGVTYIRYDSSGLVVDVDTIMNSKFPWSWSGGNPTCAYFGTYDAENIMTHELGHWIGMDDEYENTYENATMYGYGAKTEAKKVTLTGGDKTGAYKIYHP